MHSEFPLSLPAPAPVVESPAPRQPARDTFGSTLKQLGREVDRGERLVQGVLQAGGARLDAGQLIALQAGIYKYTEVVDLTAKLVDKGTQAIRTTLQSST